MLSLASSSMNSSIEGVRGVIASVWVGEGGMLEDDEDGRIDKLVTEARVYHDGNVLFDELNSEV